jgi:hypothetical protein
MCVIVQAGAAASAFFVVTTFPYASTAAQNVVDEHDRPVGLLLFWAMYVSIGVASQASAPPAGLLEVSALPSNAPTATHNEVDGQEICPTPPPANEMSVSWSTTAVLHAGAPPVGFFDVMMSPASSVTAHKDADGQEIAAVLEVSMGVTVQAEEPPVGAVLVTTFPASSTAAQNEVDGHESCRRPKPPSASTVFQVDAWPVGSVDVTI